MTTGGAAPWWRDGVIYQVYPRSFADADGDGIGDLRGIVERLDHLAWLGVDGLWLNPTFPSPDADWGFDVSDYRGVHPELGTLDDLAELVARARALGIRVLLDLVPNHTSDRHPWFAQSRTARDAPRRDWYVWRDGREDGTAPNNWRSVFGGPAWTRDERTGQWYLHNFLPAQPDLNWWSAEVRAEFDEILAWWFDRGIAGVRIDVAHGIVKDRELRDNPPAQPGDIAEWRRLGQRPVYSMNRPEVHEVLRHWRALSDARSDRPLLLGETWVHDLESLARFYGSGDDELQLAFNFVFMLADLDAGELSRVVAETEARLPAHAWPVWAIGNHDVVRAATRWAGGDGGLVRTVLMLLLTLRGTPVLYYGDELGLAQTEVATALRRDPVGLREPDADPGRDGARTPMPWQRGDGAGFTAAGVTPWLPLGDARATVADQRDDASSPLRLVRDLIALRRREPDLRQGAYAPLAAPVGGWAFRRGAGHVVALNLGTEPARIDTGAGTIAIATARERDRERVRDALVVGPGEGAVVRLG